MAKNSSVVADPVVDLEKGTVTLKEAGKEEEVAIVDPLKAKLIGFLTDTLLGIYVLIFAGLMMYPVKKSKNWEQVLQDFLILLPFMLWNFCLIPQLKKYCIKAFVKKRNGELNAKLLASEK